MSYLVGNPKGRFSHNRALLVLMEIKVFDYILNGNQTVLYVHTINFLCYMPT